MFSLMFTKIFKYLYLSFQAATAEIAAANASKPESKNEDIKKTSKAQYDALGIDFSDESDSPLESESEWEKSLKKKTELNKQTATKEKDKTEGLGEKENDLGVNSKEQENLEESRRGGLSSKRDSDFVSDESFSVDTEDQLEEIEEERLKLADEEAAKDDFAKDFDDSDFSFSENSKEEVREDDRQIQDDDIDFEDKAGNLPNEAEKSQKEADRIVDVPVEDQSSTGQSNEDEVHVQREVESDGEFELVEGSDEASLSMEINSEQAVKNEGIADEFSSESESEEGDFDQGFDDAIAPGHGSGAGIGGGKTSADANGQTSDISKDKERMDFLQNMLKKDSAAGSVSKTNIEQDDERKKKLEAMIRPIDITPIVQENVEAGIEGDEFELQDEDESDLIEEEFEKQMREKEIAAKLEEEKRKRDLLEVAKRRKAAEEAVERKKIEEEQERLEEEKARRILEEQEIQRLEEEKRRADELERIRREKVSLFSLFIGCHLLDCSCNSYGWLLSLFWHASYFPLDSLFSGMEAANA